MRLAGAFGGYAVAVTVTLPRGGGAGRPVPSCMLSHHIVEPELTADVVEALRENYATRLWS